MEFLQHEFRINASWVEDHGGLTGRVLHDWTHGFVGQGLRPTLNSGHYYQKSEIFVGTLGGSCAENLVHINAEKENYIKPAFFTHSSVTLSFISILFN